MSERDELESLRRLAELEAKAKGSSLPKAMSKQESSIWDDVKQGAGNLAAGAVRGAGSIGATILSPIDAAARAAGIQNDWIGRTDRRQAMDEGLRSLGAEPESLLYQGGKLGTEIAGTAGVGGALAKGAEAVKAAPALVNALRAYGASTGAAPATTLAARAGDLGTRVAAGALTGGASAGLVNPEDAGLGFAVGGMLPAALAAGKALVGGGARHFAGGATGAGDKSLSVAYESGKAGGEKARLFRENMRGQADGREIVDDAEKALRALKSKNSAAYNANMASTKADKTVLDIEPARKAVQDAISDYTFHGKARNPKALAALEKAKASVDEWAAADPAVFHTPEGLDALKQNIGGILDELPFEAKSARGAIKHVYDGVKQEIVDQAPAYAKAMKDYENASDLVRQISGSLSVGKNAVDDTVLRKLQSALRNNVNTNFGLRTKALEDLQQAGGVELMAPLAGQSLNNWMPRGMQMAAAPGTATLAGYAGGPGLALTMGAMSSPRLMGETAYLAGKADPVIEALRRKLYQTAPVMAAD